MTTLSSLCREINENSQALKKQADSIPAQKEPAQATRSLQRVTAKILELHASAPSKALLVEQLTATGLDGAPSDRENLLNALDALIRVATPIIAGVASTTINSEDKDFQLMLAASIEALKGLKALFASPVKEQPGENPA